MTLKIYKYDGTSKERVMKTANNPEFDNYAHGIEQLKFYKKKQYFSPASAKMTKSLLTLSIITFFKEQSPIKKACVAKKDNKSSFEITEEL